MITFVRDSVGIEDGERFLLDGGAELSPAVLREMVVDGDLGKAMERLEGTRFAFRPAADCRGGRPAGGCRR